MQFVVIRYDVWMLNLVVHKVAIGLQALRRTALYYVSVKHDYKVITSLEIKTIQLRLRTSQKKLCSPRSEYTPTRIRSGHSSRTSTAVRVPGLVPVHTTTRTAACTVQSLLSVEYPEYLVLYMFSCGHGMWMYHRIWRSWDRASWYISIVKATGCTIFRVY
jgi:hypothetical protein